MASADPKKLESTDAIKTYRYLRIGMIGAVVLLAVSITIEHLKADSWQTSISAYYYTPVRATFVGGMIPVGFSLIVIKGRGTFEDIFLNSAGMLAPVVAVAPTTDVGDCSSVDPSPLPGRADFVATIDNNFYALLIAGAVGLGVAFIIAVLVNESVRAPFEKVEKGTSLSLLVSAVALLGGWWLIENWSDFYSKAHGYAAVAMFVFLTLAGLR